MLKDFLFKKAIERPIAGMGDEKKELILNLFKQHPEFMENVAKEIEAETKSGRDAADALNYVMKKNQRTIIQIFKEGGLIK